MLINKAKSLSTVAPEYLRHYISQTPLLATEDFISLMSEQKEKLTKTSESARESLDYLNNNTASVLSSRYSENLNTEYLRLMDIERKFEEHIENAMEVVSLKPEEPSA